MLYIFAVLPVAVLWGLWFSLPLAVVCMLAFNYFFLPPLTRSRCARARTGSRWPCSRRPRSSSASSPRTHGAARRRPSSASASRRSSPRSRPSCCGVARSTRSSTRSRGVPPRSSACPEATIELGTPRRHEGRLPARGAPAGASGRSRRRTAPSRTSTCGAGSCPRSRRCSPSRSSASARARGARGRDAPPQRPRQDGAAARGLARPALAADGDRTAVGALRNETLELTEHDRRELLETIDLDSDRLSRLVADLLDLSRLEAGAAAPEPEIWALDDLVRARGRRRPAASGRVLRRRRVGAGQRRCRPVSSACSRT